MNILGDWVNTHIVLPGSRLQHSSEKAVREGEAREPEQVGGLGCPSPACKLSHSLAKIPGPRCQRLQRGICLVDRMLEKKIHGSHILLKTFTAAVFWTVADYSDVL